MTTTKKKVSEDFAFVCTQVIDSDEPLPFSITLAAIRDAVCKDASKCVVARGLAESVAKFSVLMVSNKLVRVVVGPFITKLLLSGGVAIRFSTPKVLRDSLKHFDLTGQWDLPEGPYQLDKLADHLRSDYVRKCPETGKPKKNTNKSGKSGIKLRPLPTRFVPRVCAPKAKTACAV